MIFNVLLCFAHGLVSLQRDRVYILRLFVLVLGLFPRTSTYLYLFDLSCMVDSLSYKSWRLLNIVYSYVSDTYREKLQHKKLTNSREDGLQLDEGKLVLSL